MKRALLAFCVLLSTLSACALRGSEGRLLAFGEVGGLSRPVSVPDWPEGEARFEEIDP